MKLPFLSENYCEEYVEVHWLDLHGRKECCSELSVKCAHVVAHGVVEDSKAMNTKVDPERQVELAQSWMSVDKISCERSADEERTSKRRKCQG